MNYRVSIGKNIEILSFIIKISLVYLTPDILRKVEKLLPDIVSKCLDEKRVCWPTVNNRPCHTVSSSRA